MIDDHDDLYLVMITKIIKMSYVFDGQSVK